MKKRKNVKGLVNPNETHPSNKTGSEEEAEGLLNGTASAPKPLLWINHDAKNRKARPHRRVVFTHVQGSWKKWNRKEDALAMQESVKIPDRGPVQAQQSEPVIYQPKCQSIYRMEGDNYPHFDGANGDQSSGKHRPRTMATQVHPSTILGKGNSDPFQAFAITIDARIADLLAYSRKIYLPEIFTHVNAADVCGAVSAAFAETVDFLHDESTIYPQIAKIAAVMPKGLIGSKLLSQIPMFKMKGLALLRKKLSNLSSFLNPKTSASMLLFLTAELYEGNLKAASFHGSMIAHLLQTNTIPVDFLFLFSALYDDTQRASFALSRPAFDVTTWIPQQLVFPNFMKIEQLAGQIVAEACGLGNDLIASSNLRAIITEANHCSAIALLISTDRIHLDNQTTFRFGCRRLACIGTIINHYIDSREEMRQQNGNDLVFRDARMEAQLCLALLFLMRREAKMDTFWIGAKFAAFSENHNILLNLRDLLQQEERTTDGRHASAKLFALFVGAWAGFANARAGAASALVEKEWFDVNFAAQTSTMGLRSWQGVHQVLVGFHFLALITSDGETFWKTVSP